MDMDRVKNFSCFCCQYIADGKDMQENMEMKIW